MYLAPSLPLTRGVARNERAESDTLSPARSPVRVPEGWGYSETGVDKESVKLAIFIGVGIVVAINLLSLALTVIIT